MLCSNASGNTLCWNIACRFGVGQIWPGLAQLWTKLGAFGANLAKIMPISPRFGQQRPFSGRVPPNSGWNRPCSGRSRPNLADWGQIWAKLSRSRPKLGRFQPFGQGPPIAGRVQPTSAQHRPHSGRWPDSIQFRPTSARLDRTRPNFGRCRAASAEVDRIGPCRPKLERFSPNSAKSG